MKKSSVVFLQMVLVLMGIVALTFMLLEPHFEGRNANATLFEIYFKDFFLAYVYTGSIAFYAALYQAFILLRYIGQNKVFSGEAVKTLRMIKYCAITLIGFVAVGVTYIRFFSGSDDAAGGVFIGFLISFSSLVIATAAAVFEKMLQNAVDMKSENDLTV